MEKWLNVDGQMATKYIQMLYWVLLALAVLSGLASWAYIGFFAGITRLVLGVVLVRVGCEVLIAFFNINDNLQKLADKSDAE